MSTAIVTTKGNVWIKTHFYREGDYLHAKCYLVAAGEPEIIHAKVDLRPIARWVQQRHLELHAKGGCPGCNPATDIGGCIGCDCIGEDCFEVGVPWYKSISRGIKKIGKSKLVKAISRGVKKVVRSKALKVMAGAVAVVFPPVGAPALAALAASNVALDTVERAERDARAARNILRARGRIKAGIGTKLDLKVEATSKLVLGKATARKALQARAAGARKVRGIFGKLAEAAAYHDNPATKHKAKQLAKVVNIAQTYRTKVKHIEGKANQSGLSGIVIRADGSVVKGKRWLTRGGGGAMLLDPAGKVTRGQFEAVVGGCFGCGRLY